MVYQVQVSLINKRENEKVTLDSNNPSRGKQCS